MRVSHRLVVVGSNPAGAAVQADFFAFFRSRAFFNRTSSFKYASFGTVRNFLTALSMRSASV
jgi:hypothetical protein